MLRSLIGPTFSLLLLDYRSTCTAYSKFVQIGDRTNGNAISPKLEMRMMTRDSHQVMTLGLQWKKEKESCWDSIAFFTRFLSAYTTHVTSYSSYGYLLLFGSDSDPFLALDLTRLILTLISLIKFTVTLGFKNEDQNNSHPTIVSVVTKAELWLISTLLLKGEQV
ncbi:unnamed protein product [Lactuca saligna]|uniref:Uncharacterized protein n=1 Tax=Lactuca saligna TaxID=75948 RepID=A0AA35V3M5_LACSI|nr:unnamed protein product [Lactuca saligna]